MKLASLKLIFLGTGTSQGIPVIGSSHPVCLSSDSKDKRFRSSVMIKIDETQILIDCGPDFRQQMLINNLNNLDGIMFTHEHNDHMIGLDDVRPIFQQQQKNIELFAQKRVLEEIQNRFPYNFKENKYPGITTYNLNRIEEEASFFVEGKEVVPIPVMHGRLPIVGYRIQDLAYITDASFIPESSLQKLRNLDVLVLNVLRKEPVHPTHFVLEEALEIVGKLKPKRTYFTHIANSLGFHEEVQKELPENVFLAYDGLEIEIN